MLRNTHTYTRYFSEDDPLVCLVRRAIADLRADWTKRSQYIEPEAALAGAARLAVLECGLQLLVEPVPPAFGG